MTLTRIHNLESESLGIHERLVRHKNGGLIRIRFEVRNINGVLKGRIISAEPVVSIAPSTLAISGPQVAQEITKAPEKICYPEAIISPFTKEVFFSSQMTRAPSIL